MSTVCAVGYAIARFRQSPVTGIVLAAWRLRRGSCIPQSTDAALPPVACRADAGNAATLTGVHDSSS